MTTPRTPETPRNIRNEAYALFRVIDKNGDGSIDPLELNKSLSDFGYGDNMLQELSILMDTDGDGFISEREFLNGFSHFVSRSHTNLSYAEDGSCLAKLQKKKPKTLLASYALNCSTMNISQDETLKARLASGDATGVLDFSGLTLPDLPQTKALMWALPNIDTMVDVILNNCNLADKAVHYLLDAYQNIPSLQKDVKVFFRGNPGIGVVGGSNIVRFMSRRPLLFQCFDLRDTSVPASLQKRIYEIANRRKKARMLRGLSTRQVFLNYSHVDGLDMACMLEAMLHDLGYTVWRDVTRCHAGLDCASERDDGVRFCDVVLHIITPGFLLAPVCAMQVALMRLFKKQGCCVIASPDLVGWKEQAGTHAVLKFVTPLPSVEFGATADLVATKLASHLVADFSLQPLKAAKKFAWKSLSPANDRTYQTRAEDEGAFSSARLGGGADGHTDDVKVWREAWAIPSVAMTEAECALPAVKGRQVVIISDLADSVTTAAMKLAIQTAGYSCYAHLPSASLLESALRKAAAVVLIVSPGFEASHKCRTAVAFAGGRCLRRRLLPYVATPLELPWPPQQLGVHVVNPDSFKPVIPFKSIREVVQALGDIPPETPNSGYGSDGEDSDHALVFGTAATFNEEDNDEECCVYCLCDPQDEHHAEALRISFGRRQTIFSDTLEKGDVILPIITPRFVVSAHCQSSIRRAFDLDKPIIPLYFDTIDTFWPPAGTAYVLSQLQFQDFRGVSDVQEASNTLQAAITRLYHERGNYVLACAQTVAEAEATRTRRCRRNP